MRLRPLLISCALAAMAPTSAYAQAAICALLPLQEGELALGADLLNWRTARPAVVQVVNVAAATLYVNGPTGWSLSPARTPATSFHVSAQFSGANLGHLLPTGGAISGLLSIVGTTNAAVSITGGAASPYPAGAYAAEVTVTCVPR